MISMQKHHRYYAKVILIFFLPFFLNGCANSEPEGIEITPKEKTLVVGERLSFQASAISENNEKIPGVAFKWTIDGQKGIIDENGLFIARMPGNVTVTAALGNITGQAHINIIPMENIGIEGQTDKEEGSAGTTTPLNMKVLSPEKDEIRMENKAYAKHTEGIHIFTHKKHAIEYPLKYPDIYDKGCGECHHDEENNPLTDIEYGDPVKNCIECHKIPGYIKNKDAKEKGLTTDAQKREYHANAIHDNCQGCHKAYNNKMGLKFKDKGYAPTQSKCKICHPK